MSYNRSYDGPTLVITLAGVLTPADLQAAAEDIRALEAGGTHTPHRLIDLRGITEAAIGYAEMANLAEWSRARPLASPIRSAMLVSQPVQLGFARMFQILNEHPQITMRIFEDEVAARLWISGGLDE
jgi:hypothetical protein